MTLDKDNMIAHMEHARSLLNAALERVAPQMEIYPTWKVKQLMDHIASWDELMVSTYQAYSKGEDLAMTVKYGIDQFNAESVTARKAFSLEESRQAYDAARMKVIQALREMPEEKLSQRFHAPWGGMCTVASVVKIFVSHELEHANQIEETLRNPFQKT